MPQLTAGIIIIGDEILSGRTKDTNANFIAKELIKAGIKLSKIIVISDDPTEIKKNVINFKRNFTYVFTTGGIGPTHDDVTTESISKAFKKKYKIDSRALKILKNYYPKGKLNEGRKKMAKLPEGSELIKNLKKGKPKTIATINTNLFESILASKLSKIQKKYKFCQIGSYPYFNKKNNAGGVNIVISSWKKNDLNIIISEIVKMIKLLGGKSFIV